MGATRAAASPAESISLRKKLCYSGVEKHAEQLWWVNMENYEFISTIAAVIIAAAAVGGLVLRIEVRLGERMTALEQRVSRIEGLLEGYFLQASKRVE